MEQMRSPVAPGPNVFTEAAYRADPKRVIAYAEATGSAIVTRSDGTPRFMIVIPPAEPADASFLRLVSDPEIQKRERRTQKPNLRQMVRQLQRKHVPIVVRPEISVPILGEALQPDFSFQNGARNLVKAVGLSRRSETAMVEASDLGSQGLLIAKHPDAVSGTSKLIVVAEIDDRPLLGLLDRLLAAHDVRLVEASDLPAFAAEIEREAH